jgi:DNA-directed RNA polymerase II subunit RPB3
MAIHMVNIYENTSVLHDEFITQRLALIPFLSESVDKYKYTWECDCNADSSNQCQ